MAREGLLHPLRDALQRAATGNERVRTRRHSGGDGRRNAGGSSRGRSCRNPRRSRAPLSPDFRQPRGGGARGSEEGRPLPAPKRGLPHRAAEYEVAASRQYLQATIQDLEAANEELQSANEEILSSNEELQSTNEELDTAKEELQSSNEELNTINEELDARNEELTRVNSDLVNFLANADVAIVIISHDLKVRRFTPMAEKS